MTLRRFLRIEGAYIRRYWLQWLASRGFALTLMLDQTITPLLGLLIWSAALPGQPKVAAYFVALLIVQLAVASYEDHLVAERIYSGDYSDDLLRPHPPILATLGESLSVRVWLLLLGLPILIVALWLVRYPWDGRLVLIAFPAVLLAAALHFLYIYILALSGFWSGRAHGITRLGETLVFLLGGTAVPLTFLPPLVQTLVAGLPFYPMLGFGADIAVGNLTASRILAGFGEQCLWVLALAAVAHWVAARGIRRFTAVGG